MAASGRRIRVEFLIFFGSEKNMQMRHELPAPTLGFLSRLVYCSDADDESGPNVNLLFFFLSFFVSRFLFSDCR